MNLRIDRIKVNRGGPLEGDFDFEPGDLSLIYGPNESGKTYVVESLIRFLFKTTGKAPFAKGLRDFEFGGKVMVSGLREDPMSFTRSSGRLEDHWEAGPGLPHDLSRLLVVRAGDTSLAAEADGVGGDVLKTYLSGEGILDRVASRISPTLQSAAIEGAQITGPQRGELKARETASAKLGRIQKLLAEVEERYGSGEAYALRQRVESLGTEVATLESARRYRAGLEAARITALEADKRALPKATDVAELGRDIRELESVRAKIEDRSAKLAALEMSADDHRWAQEAVGVYRTVTSGTAVSGPKPTYLVLAGVVVAATVGFGLAGITIGLVACAVLVVTLGVLYAREVQRSLASAGESAAQNAELERLKAEFKARFDADLTDLAALEAKCEELKENATRAELGRDDLRALTDEVRDRDTKIAACLKQWTGDAVSEPDWLERLDDLRRKVSELDEQRDEAKQALVDLGVLAEDYLGEDPGGVWAPERHAELTREIEGAKSALSAQETELDQLKQRVRGATGCESADWEVLITALRDSREAAAAEYRALTAEILAKIQVNSVIQELREAETSRIEEGLERTELTEPLYAITGRYRSVRLDGDRSLVLVSDQDEDFALAGMSTGVREQAFLALRMGFASIAMEGATGFLILDDAFQHSDWDRRRNLVERTLGFVEGGWQVLYFTMDDHIRDLFHSAGARIGERFRSAELG